MSAQSGKLDSITKSADCSPEKANNHSAQQEKRKLFKVSLVRHPTDGLGFNIHGGWDQPYILEDTGIFVTKIRKGGQAEKDGRLEVGDRIVKLNGQFLDNLSHQTVISLFRRAGDKIKLRVEKQALQKIESENKTGKEPGSLTTSRRKLLKHAGIGGSVLLALYMFHNRQNLMSLAQRLANRLTDS